MKDWLIVTLGVLLGLFGTSILSLIVHVLFH